MKKQIAEMMEEEKENLFRYACYRLGNVDDAEDLLQDLFIKLCSTKGDIKTLRSYLYRSLSNNCNTMLKRRDRLPIDYNSELEHFDMEEPSPNNFEQEFLFIDKLLRCIPNEQSEIIRLKIHAEKTFREIADILDIPLSTAKSRYQYGIDKLREGLKKEGLI